MRKRPSSMFVLLVGGACVIACSSSSSPSGFSGPGTGATKDGGPGEGMVFGPGGGNDSGTAEGPVDVTPPCDTALKLDDGDAASFAKAIGICKSAMTDGFGLVSAS